ncbi:MAG: DUF4900 domain-containing protein [Firmicutes bacterium]|nr:DUF4900 domain-containing protein [Bacillota bacterium]
MIFGRNIARKNGVALFLTLAILTILSIFGFGLVAVSTSYSRNVNNNLDADRAYYMARYGLSKAIDELENDYYWGTTGSTTFTIGNDSCVVTVWVPTSNATSTNKKWKVTCVGLSNGARRELTTWLQLQSFAEYAYFTDAEKNGNSTIWFTDRDQLDGKVHTNGYFSIYKNPKFSNPVTSHNNNDPYYKTNSRLYVVNGTTYSDPAKYYNVYDNYTQDYPIALNNSPDFKFSGGQPEVPLPVDTGDIADKSSQKIYQNTELTFEDTGRVKATTQQTSSYQVRVRKNGVWVYETRTKTTTETTYYATDNLTLYIGGDVTITGGTVKGKVTIGSEGDMYIEDSILYKDKTKDVLGLVSEKDIVLTTSSNTQKNIELDAVLMTLYGSFYVDNYNQGSARGTLTIYGGLIQEQRGPVGTFNSSTSSTVTGYNKNYIYDKKLLSYPPPNYPLTGKLSILSVKDNMALGN